MGTRSFSINEISGNVGISDSARVIRNSFRTVAKEFNLTRENCPTHPSFITVGQLIELKKKGLNFFRGFLGETQVGFVALEKADEALYYMEKLAVLPDYRYQGYGQKLVEFAVDYVRSHNGKKISIGTIDEHAILKNWYKKLGFREISTRKFNHLPFTVCYMEIEIPE
jgi:ribosomal protein S18 acetylase RimI-like enzyme